MKYKIHNLIVILGFSLLALNPALVYAQGAQEPKPATSTATAGSDLPVYEGVDGSIKDYLCTPSENPDGHDLERCINRLFRFGITAGALIAVFFIVFTGYLYITGGETAKTKAKQMLFSVFTGMAILLGGYLLLYFINPSLVIFKPIQPPIFDAADLPSCEDVGFGQNCVIATEDGASSTSNSGEHIPCPDGLIDFDKKAVEVNGGGDTEKICKALMEKLIQLNAKHKIIVTSTIRNGSAESSCHYSGKPKSGTCADTVSKSGDWTALCKAVKEVGGMNFLNESGISNGECGNFVKTKNWSGAHLHINLTNGKGGSVTTTGSRPYCRPIHKFLCDHPANDSGRADPHVWTSSFPEVQKNLNELKKVCGADKDPKKCLGYPINQVYRSPEYGAHMRSIFEAYAILYEGWSDQKISSHGQYCNGSIQYVKASDLKGVSKDSEVGRYIKSHFNGSAKHFSSIGSPTTCLSNHGSGIALDFEGSGPSESSVVGPGKLCHNIPPGTSGMSSGDTPHYILYSKKKSGEKCTFK